jgi:hypothetical protein
MNSAKEPRKASDVLRDLHKLMFDASPDEIRSRSHEEIAEDLAEAGIDTRKCVVDLKNRLRSMSGRLALEEAGRKRIQMDELVRASRARLEKLSVPIREQLLNLLAELGNGRPEVAAVYFRKLEESSDEDVERLVEDLRCLKDLEKRQNDASGEHI